MPSPFPGMDPFIEDQRWSGFHNRFIVELGDALIARLRPRYEVEPEERIYIETTEEDPRPIRADIAISTGVLTGRGIAGSTAVLDLEPSTYTVAMPVEVEERERYLVIRKTGDREVVTVIELLSPSNKRRGSDGRREYLKKRSDVLWSSAHLVEIDLLLGGERLPTDRPMKQATDYCAFVCRAGHRPQAEVFEWTLRDRLPRIPIPLLPGDADAIVDVQAAFNSLYDRSGYDYSLHYDVPLRLPLRSENQPWLAQLLAKRATA